jgi:hypothetical protein
MPKPETVKRALAEIQKGYAQYEYFFANLNSPAWLEPLQHKGFFTKPPEPIRDGDYVRLLIWPESRYLVRMAGIAEAQEKVLEIARTIPDSENSRVHDDIADIALSLPPRLAAKLVPQISRSTESPFKLLLAEKLSNLIPQLADGGQPQAALDLSRVALALGPDPRSVGEDKPARVREPRARFRDWYYARIVSKSLPALVAAAGLETLEVFCGLLDDAARLSVKEDEHDEDYFYIRQPAIELGTGRDDVPSVLLCATRDATVRAIVADTAKFDAAMKVFQQHKWASFRRLELHITRAVVVSPGQQLTFAEQFLKDPTVLAQPSLRHEAILLLKDVFGRLSMETQQRILAWMDADDPAEPIRQFLENLAGEEPTVEKIAQIQKVRRRDRLAILEGQLPEPYREKYDALVASVGPADPPERLPIRTFSQVGAQSPKTVAELTTMTAAEVVGFLTSWKPGSDIFSPTADGLAGSLTSTVAQRPTEFSAVTDQFKTLDPTYVRGLFAGFTSALKNGVQFGWKPVLELATWVSNQPRGIDGRKGGIFRNDPDWGWTRDAIIDLLNAGFEGGEERLPHEHRELVWTALAPLTDDPFPSQDDERGEEFDPSFLSINCTRGRALFAVLAYARWVRDWENKQKAEEAPPVTFDVMPEVRQILDRHLDVGHEPTLTIRSVYGQGLSVLANLDWEWFRSSVGRIFPLDDPAHFNAAWESFVVSNMPYDSLLREMEPVYRKAIAEINQPSMMRSPGSPKDSLADHLLAYYWRGHLTFDGADRLLEEFYKQASDGIRGHAMWYVGRSAAGWRETMPPEVLERLRSLMERRLKAAEESVSPELFAKELAGFGWWFTADQFGDAWSIGMLVRALRVTKAVEDGMDVMKVLAGLAPQSPREAIACLDLMVQGDRENWVLVGVELDARNVIKAALESRQHGAVVAARNLVELLIARGHYGFRTLLA